MRKLIYLWLMVALPACLLAQQGAIKGQVTDADGSVLSGVSNTLQGSSVNSNSTTSTSDAALSINAPARATGITYTLTLLKPTYI
jgi:hypothetical protein